MKGRLHQTHTGEFAFGGAVQHGEHQRLPDAFVLRTGVNGDRADAGNRRALIHAVAADDFPLGLGHHGVNPLVREHSGESSNRHLGRWKIRWEIVPG